MWKPCQKVKNNMFLFSFVYTIFDQSFLFRCNKKLLCFQIFLWKFKSLSKSFSKKKKTNLMPSSIQMSRLFFCVETNKLTRMPLSRMSIVFWDNSEHWFSSLSSPNICENLKSKKEHNALPDKQTYVFGGNFTFRTRERYSSWKVLFANSGIWIIASSWLFPCSCSLL